MVAKKKDTNKSKAKSIKRVLVKNKSTVKRASVKAAIAPMATKAIKTTTAVRPLGKIAKAYTKSELLVSLAARTGLAKKLISMVLAELSVIVAGHLKKNGPGKFVFPGMLKMLVKDVPAKKARKKINPFTGEPTIFKAKPGSRKIKIKALKALKNMAL